ncbi:MAG: efflux RND transporter periplasmic adaptor subunit [Tannerellaceae bacterium]|jgi:RND family efflux transporter MFP subunit|nr:efflux RND transporter periplasmic adaptor subunit [Tannerellaceae bacterium]
MKKIYLLWAFIACLFVACSSKTNTAAHGHDHEHGEACEHGHDHEDEDEDGHDHEHEHDHGHGTEAGHPDEIIFGKEKAIAAGLKTLTIQPGAFTEVIKTSGRILSAQGDEKTLVATAPGVVTLNRTKFVEGSAVQKGQAVLSLVTGNIAGGDLSVRTRAAYEKARKEYERGEELVKEKIISEKEFNRIASDYEIARAAYEAIGGDLKGGGVPVVSPINGFLKNLQVKEGDYVETGQPLATISQNSRLVLRAEVSEKYYGSLPLIQSANFRTPYDNRVYRLSDLNGRMLSYAKSPEANTFYLPVTFEFDNKGSIIPGTYIEVYLMTSSLSHTVSVPVSSLIEEQGIFSVYLQLDETCYKKQGVKLGANNGMEVQILSGIAPGDVVVTEAAYHLKLATASNAMPAHTHH